MARKRMNRCLWLLVFILVPLFILVMCQDKQPNYAPVSAIPLYREDSQPSDGDTQADTSKRYKPTLRRPWAKRSN